MFALFHLQFCFSSVLSQPKNEAEAVEAVAISSLSLSSDKIVSSSSSSHPRLSESGFVVVPSSQAPLDSQREQDTHNTRMIAARYLSTPEAVKTVIHISFEGSDFPAYFPGDSITIRCPNTIESVLFVHSRLDITQQQTVECGASGAEFWPGHIPRIVDVFQALSW
jgi:sulfite reductase alpha subunit-like flavoprotein